MKEHIMSLVDYTVLCDEEPYRTKPYIYRLEKGKRVLLYFGAEHTNDPKHPQFSLFKKKLEEFKPRIIFIEGSEWPDNIKSKQDAIAMGEGAFLTYLAKQHRIPRTSCEPDAEQLIKHLLSQFKPQELFAFFILQTLPQYHQYGKPEGYLKKQILWFEGKSKWKNFDYSLLYLNKIHMEMFSQPIDYDNPDAYKFLPYPVEDKSVFNEISAAAIAFRDDFVVTTVIDTFEVYDRILIIMGSSHAIMQEPAFREYFTE